jgi:hypothetical protein
MTGIAEDADSVMDMIEETARRLLAKEPEHELLGYLRKIHDDEVYAAFVGRFGKKDIPEHLRSNATNTAWMWAQYLVALRKALGEEPAAPVAKVKPETLAPEAPPDDLEIPF